MNLVDDQFTTAWGQFYIHFHLFFTSYFGTLNNGFLRFLLFGENRLNTPEASEGTNQQSLFGTKAKK